MSDTLRICLYTGTKGEDSAFRVPFEQLTGVLLVADAFTWDELRDWLRHGEVDAVAVDLDCQGEAGLSVVQRIVDMSPGCAVLGVSAKSSPETIIAGMRAGCSQFVSAPIDQDDLRQAIERIRATRVNEIRSSQRICVVGSCGGTGATTISCNLAMELAHVIHRRVGLVDMNLEFGDVCSSFDISPTYTVADICRQEVDIDRLLLGKALHELPCNVSIMARPNKIEEVFDVTPEGVDSMLRVLGTMFPFIVADLPRNYSFLNAAAVTKADRILIVTQLGVPFIRNATRVYDRLLHMGVGDGVVEIVLNRCNANFERIKPEEVEAHFGQPIFAMIPNDYRRVQTSLDFGHPMMADSPTSPARLAIQEMARKLASAEITVAEEVASPMRNSLFGRFWSRGGTATTT